MMSSCCTLRLKRRRAFSRDSPSCSRISAKPTHPQTRPEGPSSYYKELTGSQVGSGEKVASRSLSKSSIFRTRKAFRSSIRTTHEKIPRWMRLRNPALAQRTRQDGVPSFVVGSRDGPPLLLGVFDLQINGGVHIIPLFVVIDVD